MSTVEPEEIEFQLLSPADNFMPPDVPNPRPPLYIADWPQHATRLKSDASSDRLSTAVDLILACIPLLFLVFAILAIRLNGSEISSYGDGIIQMAEILPSIFPIIFTAIVGNMMRNYALWRAERCAPLGLLEQLNRSTSLAGTVSSAFSLGRMGPLTTAILLLWAMSPIGGQSALRMVTIVPTSVYGNTTVAYLNIVNTTSGFSGISFVAETMGAAHSIYTTSLMATQAIQHSPRDVWTFPKIPALRHLPLNTSSSSSNPWRNCNHSNQTVYSSLVGLVVQGIPPDYGAEFSVESSYFDLDCQAVAQNITETAAFAEMGGYVLHHNATNLFKDTAVYAPQRSSDSSFFIDTSYKFRASPPTQSKINLWYGTRDTSPQSITNVSLYNCTVSTIRVESWISCQNTSCAVDRVRRSEKDTRPDSLTPFDDPNHAGDNWTTLNNIIAEFPFATGVMHSNQASATDNYVYGDSPVFQDLGYIHNWSSVSEQAVSSRFTTAFNTYWQATLAPFTITGASPIQPANTSGTGFGKIFNGTTAMTSQRVLVYEVNWAWVTVFILAVLLLQLCAIIQLLLKFRTIAPDILGSVSSMTRDNPYIPLPPGGSTLSGSERARLLHDLPVQIRDVDRQNGIGYIALGSTMENGLGDERLNRRGQYR